MTHTTLCIGDVHAPFAKRRSLLAIIKICRDLKPKRIIQIGDLYDFYAFSRFARSQNIYTPKQEVQLGRKMAESFWQALREAAGPRVECFQLLGNHDERLIRKTMTLFPEIEHIIEGTSLWQFPGVQTQGAERDELILDNVCYMHGYMRHGSHVSFNQMSTVVGHSHLGGVVFHRIKDKVLFELNCGFIADTSTVPLSYTKQKTFSKHTQGVGLIDDYGPRFISLE